MSIKTTNPVRHLFLLSLALLFLVAGCAEASPTPGRPLMASTAVPPAANPSVTPEPELGIVIDTDFQIVEVRKGSAAEEAGLKRGDVLQLLNDERFEEPVETFLAYRNYIHANPGKGVPLTIESRGKVVELEIVPALPPPPEPGAPTPTLIPDEWASL